MIGLLGYNFCSDGNTIDPMPTNVNKITSTKISGGVFTHINESIDIESDYSTTIPTEWDVDTILNCAFNDSLGAGNLGEVTKNVTSIRIKRRKKGTFDWITIKEIPINTADDFTFIFTDNLASNFTQYEYAYVPVQDQTEGGYIVEEIYSKFNGVFICDADTAYKFYAGVEYGSTNSVQKIGTYEPFGRKYPVIVSNGVLGYDQGNVSGLVLPKNYEDNKIIDRRAIVSERNTLIKWLTNKKPKMLKDWNGNEWLIIFVGNPQTSYDSSYGMGVQSVSAEWTQTGDPTNKSDLYVNGLIPRED